MPRSPDEIEASLLLPDDITESIVVYKEDQDTIRGARWPSPREANQPSPPWPSQDNVMLRYLLIKAEKSIAAGMDRRTALSQLAVHAWFEGGVENYDRGQMDGRRPRPVS